MVVLLDFYAFCCDSGPVLRPFGGICGHGGNKGFNMMTPVLPENNYLTGSKLKLGKKFWYLQLLKADLLGLNITVLKGILAHSTNRLLPKLIYKKRTVYYEKCLYEYLYIEFFTNGAFLKSYQGHGPYCGIIYTFSLISTAFAKITLKTFEGSTAYFELVFQATDLGYIITRSHFLDNTLWLDIKKGV